MSAFVSKLFANVKLYVYTVAAALGAILYALLRLRTSQRDAARSEAKGERQAREAITDVHNRRKKVADNVRRSPADERRERLRKYASPRRDD